MSPVTRRTRPTTACRAQVEPLAALAALFAVCVGLSVYAGVLVDAGEPGDRDLAGPTLSAVDDALTVRGVVDPGRLDRALDRAPAGHHLSVALTTDERRWTAGPTPEVRGDRAAKRVSVRLGPGRVRVGRLRVVVWR